MSSIDRVRYLYANHLVRTYIVVGLKTLCHHFVAELALGFGRQTVIVKKRAFTVDQAEKGHRKKHLNLL
jgi:hypothetical protein